MNSRTQALPSAPRNGVCRTRPAGSIRTLPTAVVVGSALLAGLLSGCGGGGGSSSTPAEPAGAIGAREGALQASRPGELLAYAKSKLAERQGLRAQFGQNAIASDTIGTDALLRSVVGVPTSSTAAGEGSAAAAVDRSGTTLQEAGVEEDDLLKSDGTLIYTLSREARLLPQGAAARITVNRLGADGNPEVAGNLTLDSGADVATVYTGMYLASAPRRVAALGSSRVDYTLNFCDGLPTCASVALLPFPQVSEPRVILDVASVADPGRPVLSERLRIDGQLIGSRMIGSSLVLVTRFAPRLAVDALPWTAPAAERDALLARLSAAELLPTFSVNGGASTSLVGETDCHVEPGNASYGLEVTTITTVDMASPTLQQRSRCFIGGSEAMYMSPTALYLATTRYDAVPASGTARRIFPPEIRMDVHKFALTSRAAPAGASVDYRGSGTVPGHLGWNSEQRSYRMSEHNGDLRVLSFTGQSGWAIVQDATTTSAPAPSPATLTVLRERTSDRTLQTVSTLPNSQRPQALGKPGEQVYAVRFIGDRGYVVTFRRTDPLYVLDLADPADTKSLGELTIAGFSDYLFPVGAPGSGLLLGVGKDADDRGRATGVKVTLFDVADPTRPMQKASITLGSAGSSSALDVSRHGIDLFTQGDQTRVVLPVLAAAANFSSLSFALQRFEVDGSTRTMHSKSALATTAPGSAAWPDLAQVRTLQIGSKLFHFDGRTLAAYDW